MVRVIRRIRSTAIALTVMAVAVALLAGASYVVMPKNNQAEFGQVDATAHGVMGEPTNSIDVLFLGDSEAFSSFSPLQLWGERGITSYTCATSAQRLSYTRTLLARALKRQRPRVVMVETDCVYARLTLGDAAFRLLSDVFPIFEYHDRWKHLRPEDIAGSVRQTWTDELKGFRLDHATDIKAADASSHMAETDKVARVSRLNRLHLNEIHRMCTEHGAKLVLVSTPSTVNWNMARHRGIEQFAREMGVDYYDFNLGEHKVSIDWSCETYDGGDHLNLAGAKKVTSAVGALLSGVYDMPDHRQDAAFDAWNDAYGRYQQRLSAL